MKFRIIIVVTLLGLAITSQAGAAPQFLPHAHHLTLKQKVAYFERSIHKERTTITWLVNHNRSTHLRWWRAALHWHTNLLAHYSAKLAPPPPTMNYWIVRQMNVAATIARSSGGDPWPNCPDPYDGSGASWYDTVSCENGGNWYDSPGYYRCGLQFDPGWEIKYGRLCP